LSTVIKDEELSMPARIHAVERPVPDPSSRNRPDGFEVARVLNSEQVNESETIENPVVTESLHMSSTTLGSFNLSRSFIEFPE
jgi:hypothetical protein